VPVTPSERHRERKPEGYGAASMTQAALGPSGFSPGVSQRELLELKSRFLQLKSVVAFKLLFMQWAAAGHQERNQKVPGWPPRPGLPFSLLVSLLVSCSGSSVLQRPTA
jgi:hypothetical protein